MHSTDSNPILSFDTGRSRFALRFVDSARAVCSPAPRWLRPLLTAFIIFVGFVLATPLDFFKSQQVLDERFNILDNSWMVDLPARLQWNEWAGRDLVYTYGPLYQVTHALGLLWSPGHIPSLFRFHGVVESALCMLGAWYVLRATGCRWRWRAPLYLFWAALYSSAWGCIFFYGIKPMGAACLLALCAWELGQGASTDSQRPRGRSLILWVVTAPLLFLYTFDMGLFAMFTLLMAGGLTVLSTWREGSVQSVRIRHHAIVLMGVAVGAFAIMLLTFRLLPGWGNYWTDSAELARGYLLVWSNEISSWGLWALLLTGALLMGTLVWLFLKQRRDLAHEVLQARTTAFLGFACFALLSTRSGFTRSDAMHVIAAITPGLLLFAFFWLCYLHAEAKKIAPLLTLGFFPAACFIATPTAPSLASNALQHLQALASIDFRTAQLEVKHEEVKQAVAIAKTMHGEALFVWPFQTVVNVVAQKRNPVYTVQAYAAVTPRLEQATVNGFAKFPHLDVLLILQRWPLDGVENLTRNSQVFECLLQNYEATSTQQPGYLKLQRRPEHRAGKWEKVPLPFGVSGAQPAANQTMIFRFGEGKTLASESDLFSFEMRCAPTRFYGVRKPGYVQIEFTFADGEKWTQRIVLLPDGEEHEILVSALTPKDPRFVEFFAAAPRIEHEKKLREISLRWLPLDSLSVAPAQISVSRVSKWEYNR